MFVVFDISCGQDSAVRALNRSNLCVESVSWRSNPISNVNNESVMHGRLASKGEFVKVLDDFYCGVTEQFLAASLRKSFSAI